jgi:hypothetical protein
MSLKLRAVLAATLVAVLSPSALAAQTNRDIPAASGWAEVYPPNIRYEGITAAERSAAIALLKRIEALFRQIPELASPTEFVVKKDYFGGHRPQEVTNGVAAYSLRLWFFTRYGPEKVAAEGGTCIQVVVNAGPGGPKTDEHGKPFDIESERGEPLPGTTVVNGRLIQGKGSGIAAVYTQGGTFPWTPLTREQYLRTQIFEFEGKDGAKLKELGAQMAKTPYEEWMAGAAQRKKDRDDLARQLQGIQTNEEIKNTIAQQEKQELQMTQELKARDAEDRLRNQQAVRVATGPGDDLRARLAAMSAEERARPAMVFNNWEMPADGTPNTFRVLTPTLDYWKVRRSPVEIRTLVVNMGGASGTCATAPVLNAIWQTYQKLDWSAIKQMVEAPS